MSTDFNKNQDTKDLTKPSMTIDKYVEFKDDNITLNSILSYTIVIKNTCNIALESVFVIENLNDELEYIVGSLKINGLSPFDGDINLNDVSIIPIGTVRPPLSNQKTNALIVITFDSRVIGVPKDNIISNYSRVVFKYYNASNQHLESNLKISNKVTLPFVTEIKDNSSIAKFVDHSDYLKNNLTNIEPNTNDIEDESNITEIYESKDKYTYESKDKYTYESKNKYTIDDTATEIYEVEVYPNVNDVLDVNKNPVELVQIVSPQSPSLKQPILYSLYIKNTSSEPLGGVIIQDTIPKGASFINSSFTVDLRPYIIRDNIVSEFELSNGIEIGTIPANSGRLIQYQVMLNRRTYKKPLLNISNIYYTDLNSVLQSLSVVTLTTISNLNFYSSNYYVDATYKTIDEYEITSEPPTLAPKVAPKKKKQKIIKNSSSKQFRKSSTSKRKSSNE